MNANFDLNINNYTVKELEEILELPPVYDISTVEMKESKLRLNIINAKNIVETVKVNTLSFISNVKNKLIANKGITNEKNNKNSETSVNQIKGDILSTFSNIYNLNDSLHVSETVDAGSTTIIKQPVTPYGRSQPSEFYQGAINPLNKRILRQNINIDTRFRENYYTTNASNFHVNLPIRLAQVVSLQLSALELPNTFYVISKVFNNNFFVLEIEGESPQLVTIPDGNYDFASLQNFINNFLTNLNSPYSNIKFLADINTGISGGISGAGSGKMVVGTNDSTSVSFSFSINFLTDHYGYDDKQTPLPLKLGWLMGFREGYYENASTYVSEGIVNLLGPRYIYLVVDDYNNSVNDGFYGAFSSSILNKNILARISLQGSVFNYLSQNNYNLITTPRQYFGPVDIQKIQIQLLDEYGRILDLNNMDYSFCLTFQTIYDL